MKIINKSIITKILILVALILIGVVISVRFLKPEKSRTKEKKQIHQVLVDFVKLKKDLWISGDIKEEYEAGELTCPQYLPKDMIVDSSFFECNPLFLLCKTQKIEIFEDKNFKFLKYKINHHGSLILTYLIEGISFDLKFEDSCRSTYLPQKLYNAGPVESEKYIWDNTLENIYIDKKYFSNLDFALANKSKLENIENPHMPVLNKKKNEMQNLCSSLGGQLLENRYFDAAVNYPAPISHRLIKKFPYPWTKRREVELGDSKSDCLRSYSKECTQFEYVFRGDYSPSWIGIYNSLGGYMEFLNNKFYPDASFKVSSRDILRRSGWDQNFYRESIKEEIDLSKYNRSRLGAVNIRDWAFRCMFLE